MILAELAGGVPHCLQRGCDGWGLVGHADGSSGLPHRGQTSSDRQFSRDKVGTARGAAWFRVIVGEAHALGREPVEVRGRRVHNSLVVSSDVEPANIVTHDHDDVGLLWLLRYYWRARRHQRNIRR